MESPDLVKIARAIQRLDDICREAQQLRTELARLAIASLPWPELQLVPRDAGSAQAGRHRSYEAGKPRA